jgi:hypothetical protein
MKSAKLRLFILVSLFFPVFLKAQETLAKSLENLKVEYDQVKQYVDKKAIKTYVSGRGESFWFHVVFTNVKFSRNTGLIQIEGYTLNSESVSDTSKTGLCCIEILVAQVNRKYLLKNVRNFGDTNDSQRNPSQNDGHFFIEFHLEKKDAIIFYFPNRIVEFKVGRLLENNFYK